MLLQRITSPTALPIRIEAVKDHLRLERDDATQDDDLTELIWTATAYLQDRCRVQLINTQYKAYWDCFPEGDRPIRIPLWPIVSIDSLAYIDINGDTQAITDYQSKLYQVPATLVPAINGTWPAVQTDKVSAVTLTFTAGNGTSYTGTPYMMRHAIKLLIAHWYRNREAVLTGTISKEIEFALEALISRLRVNEFEAFQFDDSPLAYPDGGRQIA